MVKSKELFFQMRVTPEEKEKLKKLAEKENRSVANYIKTKSLFFKK